MGEDRVRVQVIGTDVEQGFIDFARAGRRQKFIILWTLYIVLGEG